MQRENHERLKDLLVAIKRIKEYMEGVRWEEFLANSMLHDAVLYRFIVIGEAARDLSDSTKNDMEDVNWDDIIGMRHILTHEYFRVRLRRVWNTFQEDLPCLERKIKAYLA